MGRILVALDDSENAKRAVDYVVQNFSRDQEVTFFSVLPDTAAICDINSPELTPYFVSQQGLFCAMEDKKQDLLQKAQEEARAALVSAGFDKGKITLRVDRTKKGVARDIVREARSGYDTVVLGRRGLSGVEEFIFGGVSHKVLSLAKDFTVVLVR